MKMGDMAGPRGEAKAILIAPWWLAAEQVTNLLHVSRWDTDQI